MDYKELTGELLEKANVLLYEYPYYKKEDLIYNEKSKEFVIEETHYNVLDEEESEKRLIIFTDETKDELLYRLDKAGLSELSNFIDWNSYFENISLEDYGDVCLTYNNKDYYIEIIW